MDNLIFLDTETTGFKNPRLIQLAYTGAGYEAFNQMYNPTRDIEFEAMAIHHITNEMVADKPKFQESEDQEFLQKLLNENVVVAHNAQFDMRILGIEGVVPREVICTYKCALKLLAPTGYDGKHKLQILRYALKLNITEEVQAHDALGDVIVLMALFNHLLELAPGETREEKIEHMIELSK